MVPVRAVLAAQSPRTVAEVAPALVGEHDLHLLLLLFTPGVNGVKNFHHPTCDQMNSAVSMAIGAAGLPIMPWRQARPALLPGARMVSRQRRLNERSGTLQSRERHQLAGLRCAKRATPERPLTAGARATRR